MTNPLTPKVYPKIGSSLLINSAKIDTFMPKNESNRSLQPHKKMKPLNNQKSSLFSPQKPIKSYGLQQS